MPSAPAIITNASPMLWAAARVLLQTFFELFGDPAHIAGQHKHSKKQRTLLLPWLRACEAIMRHLLLIEASHYAKPNTRPLLRAPRKRVRRLVAFHHDKPEDWRVSFHCLPNTSPRRTERVAKPARPRRTRVSHADRHCPSRWAAPKFYCAWPLALRAEAMLRVFNDPTPYARRLSRRLHATPHRAAALTRYPPNLPHVVDHFPALQAEAKVSRRRFESG